MSWLDSQSTQEKKSTVKNVIAVMLADGKITSEEEDFLAARPSVCLAGPGQQGTRRVLVSGGEQCLIEKGLAVSGGRFAEDDPVSARLQGQWLPETESEVALERIQQLLRVVPRNEHHT